MEKKQPSRKGKARSHCTIQDEKKKLCLLSALKQLFGSTSRINKKKASSSQAESNQRAILSSFVFRMEGSQPDAAGKPRNQGMETGALHHGMLPTPGSTAFTWLRRSSLSKRANHVWKTRWSLKRSQALPRSLKLFQA